MTNYQIRTAKANIERYEKSTDTKLSNVYNNYSVAKEYAFRRCIQEMVNRDGFGLRIISSNSFMFTVGFRYVDSDTGVLKFVYITPNYIAEVDY